MADEQFERKMTFIVDTLAQLAVNDQQHDIRLSRLERIAKLMVRAGRRERQQLREQSHQFEEQFTRVNEALAQLAASQTHSDSRLDALIDIVRRQQNGAA